jgi:hypothetical protein
MRFTALLSSGLLLCCAIPSDSAPSPDESVPLTLEASILGTSWGERIDPDRDCKFRGASDRLVIEVPGKYHDLWPADKQANAPRLLTEVTGDFDVQLRVAVTAKLSEDSTVKGRTAEVCAGLILILQNSLIRFEFGLIRENGGLAYWAERDLHGFGGNHVWAREGRSGWDLPRGLRSLWLRLERRGSRLDSKFSADGKKWLDVYPGQERSLSDLKKARVKVGLFAASTSSEPFAPRFDHWKLTPVASPKKRD